MPIFLAFCGVIVVFVVLLVVAMAEEFPASLPFCLQRWSSKASEIRIIRSSLIAVAVLLNFFGSIVSLVRSGCTMEQNQVMLRHQKFTFPRARE